MTKLRRALRWMGFSLAALFVLFLVSFAIPIRTWRTGELETPPLPLRRESSSRPLSERVWIDTDAACGSGRTADADDCLALLLLLGSPDVQVAGISTVYGNRPLPVTDQTTRELVSKLARRGRESPPVLRGSETPMPTTEASAHRALRMALEQGPLTIVALGPLTNIAAALESRPHLRSNVSRLVAVMGRRTGHLFHPAEGKGDGMLFGHGPVFSDFNFAQDRAAARRLVQMEIPMTLVPYEAGRDVTLTTSDLARMANAGRASRWVAERARGWLDFWKEEVGLDGFYPFDLVAAALVLRPAAFRCARVPAWIAPARSLFGWLYSPVSFLVGLPKERPEERLAETEVDYCPAVDPELHHWLVERLAATDTRGSDRTSPTRTSTR